MKITKERLKEIIKEELELAEQAPMEPAGEEQSGEPDEAAKTKAAFSKALLDLSKSVRGLQGLDAAEIQIVANTINSLIKYADANSGKAILTQIKTIIDKKIGA